MPLFASCVLGPRPFVGQADMDPAPGADTGSMAFNCITSLTPHSLLQQTLPQTLLQTKVNTTKENGETNGGTAFIYLPGRDQGRIPEKGSLDLKSLGEERSNGGGE